jgi:hypothetical protein
MASFSPMEFCNATKRNPLIEALPIGFNTKSYGSSNSSIRTLSQLRSRSSIVAAANKAESRSCKLTTAVAPFKPGSSEGKFLSCLLQSKPHLFQFALSEQLDELASEREAAAGIKKKPRSMSMVSLLYGRIAEMKEKERQTAVEDIMYMSIVHKFLELQIPLSEGISNNNQEIWSSKCWQPESVHKPEVQEMIREHLSIILLRLRGKSNIDRIQLGRIYASSVMYGYFLKSACFRRAMDFSLSAQTQHFSLRNYIEGFNSQALQRCAKLKSLEAVNVIEKHAWALFGDEKHGLVEPDREISVTSSYLQKLVLEAVAFGSFLWDVESLVDSVYTLSIN